MKLDESHLQAVDYGRRQAIHTLGPYLASMLAGAGYVASVFGAFGHGTSGDLWPVVVAASAMMFLIGLGLSLFGRIPVLMASLFVFAGLCGGVLFDAAVSALLKHADRNLFPIEIVLLALIGFPGFILGASVGFGMKRVRRRL